jgi:hypothetical protein
MTRDLFASFKSKAEDCFRILSLWLFQDVIFAIIPLLVIAGIKVMFREDFAGFSLIKEWSFASIVFFGVAIRRFVRLKVRLQLAPHSYKLDAGVQM